MAVLSRLGSLPLETIKMLEERLLNWRVESLLPKRSCGGRQEGGCGNWATVVMLQQTQPSCLFCIDLELQTSPRSSTGVHLRDGEKVACVSGVMNLLFGAES